MTGRLICFPFVQGRRAHSRGTDQPRRLEHPKNFQDFLHDRSRRVQFLPGNFSSGQIISPRRKATFQRIQVRLRLMISLAAIAARLLFDRQSGEARSNPMSDPVRFLEEESSSVLRRSYTIGDLNSAYVSLRSPFMPSLSRLLSPPGERTDASLRALPRRGM